MAAINVFILGLFCFTSWRQTFDVFFSLWFVFVFYIAVVRYACADQPRCAVGQYLKGAGPGSKGACTVCDNSFCRRSQGLWRKGTQGRGVESNVGGDGVRGFVDLSTRTPHGGASYVQMGQRIRIVRHSWTGWAAILVGVCSGRTNGYTCEPVSGGWKGGAALRLRENLREGEGGRETERQRDRETETEPETERAVLGFE